MSAATSRRRRRRLRGHRPICDRVLTVLFRCSMHGASEREQSLQFAENPVVVPSARRIRGQVTAWFAAAGALEEQLWALEFRGEDPDWHGDLEEFHRCHVEPARDAAYDAAVAVLENLALGGRPPRRWRLQRRYRQLQRLDWELREGRWRLGRRGPDPWARAPIAGSRGSGSWDDEAPF